MIGRLLCKLGFHTPGLKVFGYHIGETIQLCGRPFCDGTYQNDRELRDR